MRRLQSYLRKSAENVYPGRLPKFHWSAEAIAAPLASVCDRQSRLTRHMEALGFNLQQEAILQTSRPTFLKKQ
jgi:hypothetical protein